MKSLKWIISALAIVGFVTLAANGFFLDELNSSLGEANVLAAESSEQVEIITPEGVALEVSAGNNSGDLQYSSHAEVYRFALDAKAPYVLRYVSFQVGWSGLSAAIGDVKSWKLYAVEEGEVDYLNQLGVGEDLHDGVLKVRLSSGRASAYQGESGEVEFALTTSVLRDGETGEEAWISVGMPAADWAWAPGFYEGAWLAVNEYFGAEFVSGLPNKVVEKR